MLPFVFRFLDFALLAECVILRYLLQLYHSFLGSVVVGKEKVCCEW